MSEEPVSPAPANPAKETKPRRRRRRDKTKPVVKIPQIDRCQLQSPFAPLTPLDEEQLEFVHDVSLQILEEQGIEVLGDLALDTFRNAGAEVSKDGMVRMDRALVLETIAHAPNGFNLVARNPENTIRSVSYTHLTLPTIYSV